MHRIFSLLVLILLISLLATKPVFSQEQVRLLDPQQHFQDKNHLPDTKEPFVEQSGMVQLNLLALPQTQHQPSERSPLAKAKIPTDLNNEVIEIALFPDTVYRVRLESVIHRDNGTTIWTGKIEKRGGRFTLIVAPDGYILTLKDGKTMYRSAGNAETGKGFVRKINLAKIPFSYDETPDISIGDK